MNSVFLKRVPCSGEASPRHLMSIPQLQIEKVVANQGGMSAVVDAGFPHDSLFVSVLVLSLSLSLPPECRNSLSNVVRRRFLN